MEESSIIFSYFTAEQLTVLLRVLQLVGIVIPMIGIIVILRKEQSKAATYLMMSNASCAILNCAYLLQLDAGDFAGASAVYRMEYITVSLFFYFFILFLMEYQQLPYSKIFSIGWVIFEAIEIPQMWMKDVKNIGLSTEKVGGAVKNFGMLSEHWMGDVSVTLDERFGLFKVNMTGGILYQARNSALAAVLFLVLLITLLRFIKMENRTVRHNLGHLLTAEAFLLGVLIFSFCSDKPFDIVPIASALVVCAITLSVMVGEFFTVTDRGRDWVFEHIDNVFLIADDQYGYLDANTYAKDLFPQLRHYRKNQILPGDVLHLFLTAGDEVVIGDRYYNRKITTLYQNEKRKKKIAGYSLILIDMTKQYQLVEEAEAANESKSTFLSNMSHEIRTPMNAIVGMTEMMLRSDLTEEQQGYLLNIKNSGDALLTIINDILDFSKIESGHMELVEDEYAPMSMFSDIGMMFLTRIGEKPVELLFDIDAKMPNKLYGDGLRVRQVLINILNNAVKFTEQGSVKLQLAVVSQTGEDIELSIRITDTGQGIREEDIDKLFGSFSQVDSRRNHSKEGTGLGLAICKQLIEMMGGTIGVESKYGEGSSFFFTIKQKVATDEPAAYLPEDVLWTTGVKGEDTRHRIKVGAYFTNPLLTENFMRLAETYEVEVVPAKELYRGEKKADFFFTDLASYQKYGKDMLAQAQEENQICVLQNPMLESLRDTEVTVVNKPLYSLNFCQTLKREHQAGFAHVAHVLDFKAPDADVLLVDDNKMNLKVAIGLLSPLQMKIDTAENGKEAIDKIVNKKYDLVFMDHMMPIMDGVEATKRIRQMDGVYYQQLPILALTADAMSGAKAEFLKAGMNDFVAKPIEMKEISGKLKQYLPKEKVLKSEMSTGEETETGELPEIEGLHVAEGVKYSGGIEMFVSLLGDFYKLIDSKSNKIEKCLADGMIRDYTIEVHALKNTARMIGALELSEMFQELEALGNEDDRKRLEDKTPKVLELYRGYKEILRPYGAVDESRLAAVDVSVIRGLLETMAHAMDTFDLDGVDDAMEELEGYQLPEACRDRMDNLRAYVADVAMEDVIRVCREMEELL